MDLESWHIVDIQKNDIERSTVVQLNIVKGIRIMEHVVIALVGVIMASIIVPTSLIAMLKAMPNGRQG